MTDPDTLLSVQSCMITAGLIRDPSVAGVAPPAWLTPQDGVPAPGEGDPPFADPKLVVGIFRSTGVPSKPFEGFIRIDGVEFLVRSADAQLAVKFEADTRKLLNDRRDWDMGTLHVNESRLVRDLQPLGSGPDGYIFNFEYQIERWS